MKYEIIYPNLPTRFLTLVFFDYRKYYFGISEYDYNLNFKSSFYKLIESKIANEANNDMFATFDNPYILYVVDHELVI